MCHGEGGYEGGYVFGGVICSQVERVRLRGVQMERSDGRFVGQAGLESVVY